MNYMMKGLAAAVLGISCVATAQAGDDGCQALYTFAYIVMASHQAGAPKANVEKTFADPKTGKLNAVEISIIGFAYKKPRLIDPQAERAAAEIYAESVYNACADGGDGS